MLSLTFICGVVLKLTFAGLVQLGNLKEPLICFRQSCGEIGTIILACDKDLVA